MASAPYATPQPDIGQVPERAGTCCGPAADANERLSERRLRPVFFLVSNAAIRAHNFRVPRRRGTPHAPAMHHDFFWQPELKQEVGLGHFEGRGWRGFQHQATLCIAAYGFLVSERERNPPSGSCYAPGSKNLPFPKVIDPEAPPPRTERHVPNSIALGPTIVRCRRHIGLSELCLQSRFHLVFDPGKRHDQRHKDCEGRAPRGMSTRFCGTPIRIRSG